MDELEAIPTQYGRFRFRSRLEARWAVFFDALGIPYEYEWEGYQFGGRRYLADFWLPRLEAWVEIKPKQPTREEHDKAFFLAGRKGHPVYLFHGGIRAGETWAYRYDGGVKDDEYRWCECPVCGELGIEFQGFANRLPCMREGCRGLLPDGRVRCVQTPRLVKAYQMSTEAHFRRRNRAVEQLPDYAPYTKFLHKIRSEHIVFAEMDLEQEALELLLANA